MQGLIDGNLVLIRGQVDFAVGTEREISATLLELDLNVVVRLHQHLAALIEGEMFWIVYKDIALR